MLRHTDRYTYGNDKGYQEPRSHGQSIYKNVTSISYVHYRNTSIDQRVPTFNSLQLTIDAGEGEITFIPERLRVIQVLKQSIGNAYMVQAMGTVVDDTKKVEFIARRTLQEFKKLLIVLQKKVQLEFEFKPVEDLDHSSEMDL